MLIKFLIGWAIGFSTTNGILAFGFWLAGSAAPWTEGFKVWCVIQVIGAVLTAIQYYRHKAPVDSAVGMFIETATKAKR